MQEKTKNILKFVGFCLLWVVGAMTLYLTGVFVGYSVAYMTLKYPELYTSGIQIIDRIRPTPTIQEGVMYLGLILGAFLCDYALNKETKLRPYIKEYLADFNKRVDAKAIEEGKTDDEITI